MKSVKSVTMLLVITKSSLFVHLKWPHPSKESVIAHLGLLERIANNHVLKDSGGKDAAKYVIA